MGSFVLKKKVRKQGVVETPVDRQTLRVGSALDNDIVIDDPLVSPYHCQLEWIGGQCRLSDTQSVSGTYVGDQPITEYFVLKDGQVFMLTGSPGGRTIINTVLLTLINVIDFGMNIQEAVDAPRFHHQWLPDRIVFERRGLSPDTIGLLEAQGHVLVERARQGAAQAIVHDVATGMLEGGADRRSPGSTALGY